MIPPHFQPPVVLARNGNMTLADGLGYGPEAEANARLIAAAPELLEQVLALVNFLDETDVRNSLARGSAGLERATALQFLARAAIAKATGQPLNPQPSTINP